MKMGVNWPDTWALKMEDKDKVESHDKQAGENLSEQGKLKTSLSQIQATHLVRQMDKEGEGLRDRPFQHCNVDKVRTMPDFRLDSQSDTLIILPQSL